MLHTTALLQHVVTTVSTTSSALTAVDLLPYAHAFFVLLSLQTVRTLGLKLRNSNPWVNAFEASMAFENTIKNILTIPPLTIIHISKRSKGNDIVVTKNGVLGFWSCNYALKQTTDCIVAVYNDCHPLLLKEHGLNGFPKRRDRQYKFPGCKNHSYKELRFIHDDEGAYWCDLTLTKTIYEDPRPRGCVLCLRPFKFSTSNKKSKNEKK